MPTDSSSLKKIKTAQIALTCQGISTSSFNNAITLSNETDTPNHYFNNQLTNKYMNTKQTPKNNRGKIYLWRGLPVTPETPRVTFYEKLTNIYNTAPNTNTILHLGKGDPTIYILKSNKDHNIGTSYQSISLYHPLPKH